MGGRIAWIVPATADVTTVMSGIVVGATSVGNTQPSLDLVVSRIRGAIREGNRIPLSLTSGSIPPGAKQHCLNLTIELIVASTPNMTFAVKDTFENLLRDAKDWLKAVGDGKKAPEYPADPDQTTVPSYGYGGDVPVDLSTDGAQSVYAPPSFTSLSNPPSNVQAIAGKAQIFLTWETPNNPPDFPVSYSVFRGTASGAESTTPVVTGLVQTNWLDVNATSGQFYYYYVIAQNAQGNSHNSNEASAKAL